MVTKSKMALNPKFPAILQQYNLLLQAHGKVNTSKFFKEIVQPDMPEVSFSSWYEFLRRFKTVNGIQPVTYVKAPEEKLLTEAQRELANTLRANDEATQIGVKSALNLGARFFEMLWLKYTETPENLSTFEKKVLSEALFKTMKAQDSRIHAIGKVKADSREEEKMARAFDESAFE